jgi:hypothetical protein
VAEAHADLPDRGLHQAERRAGNGQADRHLRADGLNATHCASSSITKPIRLCPPSNRTAEPVKHPLIPMTGCVFMALSSLLLWFG